MSETKDKKFFIIKKVKWSWGTTYTIYEQTMYDLTTAVKRLLALDTLNEDRERNSYHLQEVNFSMVEEPLVLTDEVKNNNQEELPF